MGVAADRLLLVKQVHGIHVAVARRGESTPWARPQADLIVSDDPGVAIGVRVADCAPVLLYDPVKNAVGAAHAGWRGAASGAAAAAVRAMQSNFGSHPSDLVAAIGPCLGACCGEVGPEVVEAFRAGGANRDALARWFSKGTGDRSFLDLERANRDQLQDAGMHPDAIFASGLCTKTHRAASALLPCRPRRRRPNGRRDSPGGLALTPGGLSAEQRHRTEHRLSESPGVDTDGAVEPVGNRLAREDPPRRRRSSPGDPRS